MSGSCELGRGLRRREKNATEGGEGRFEKPAPDARAAPPEAHESLVGRKTVEEVPLTGLSFGLLANFVGMFTDSRSFLSFPRHEYFRRLLCGMLGADVEAGLIPADMNLLKGMVRDIAYRNAAAFFGMPAGDV